jgi:hypothetical protein
MAKLPKLPCPYYSPNIVMGCCVCQDAPADFDVLDTTTQPSPTIHNMCETCFIFGQSSGMTPTKWCELNDTVRTALNLPRRNRNG